MSIDSTTNRVDYLGNGATQTFSYNFKIFHQSNLKVVKRDSSGVETQLALNADYTVTGVGETNGGTIYLVNGALPSGTVITIRRVVDPVQTTDIRNQSELYREVLEDQFDYQTMVDQMQSDDLSRSVKLPETIKPSEFDIKLPTSIKSKANKTLIINDQGTGFDFGLSALEIEGFVTAAETAKALAQTAATNAHTSEVLAEQYKTQAQVSAASSDQAKVLAQAAQAASEQAKNDSQAAQVQSATSAAQAIAANSLAQYAAVSSQASADLSKDWATKMGGTVDGTGYSSKYWAEQASAYRIKFYQKNQLIGFATELNFEDDLKVSVQGNKINVRTESITYIPAPYSFTLTAAQIASGEVQLPQAPPYPDSVRLVPEGGIEQVNGVDYQVVGTTLSWKGKELESLLEVGERILLIY